MGLKVTSQVNTPCVNNINSTFFKGTTAFDSSKIYAILKQKEQERKVDNFFGTHKEASNNKMSFLALTGAIIGVIIPTIMIAKKQNPKLKADNFKNTLKFLDVNYEFKEILAVGRTFREPIGQA